MHNFYIYIILTCSILFNPSLYAIDIIVLMGVPGSGKGSFSQYAKNRFIPINPGHLLRDEIARASILGIEIKEKVEQGELIDNTIVWNLVEMALIKAVQQEKGVILDAFPLSLENLDSLIHYIEKNPDFIFSFFYLEAPMDICVSRIVGRKSCLNCGSIYHDVTHPSKICDCCDICNTPLSKRTDDCEKYALARVNKAQDKLNVVLRAIKMKGIQVTIIDTSSSLNDCHEKYKKLLESYK